MKDEYDFSDGVRGPVFPMPPGKTRITIRIDDEVLEWFRAQVHAMGGGNYQTLMNDALRDHIAREMSEPVEEMVRRVVREELASLEAADKRAKAVNRAEKKRQASDAAA